MNWKVFWVLFGASLFGIICVLPFVLTLQGDLIEQVPLPLSVIIGLSVVQSGMLFFVLTLFGLILAKKVGLGAPLLEDWSLGKDVRSRFKSILGVSVGIGLVVGFLIIVGDLLFSFFVDIGSIGTVAPPVWQGFLASFYGAINEEIMMRLFLVSLFVWVFSKIRRRKEDGKSADFMLWFAIVLSAVLFGLGHLPVTASLVALTPLIVTRAIVLNGIGGIAFGWLYWRKGLESAMIAHFSTDIILYVVLPLFLSFLSGS